MSDKKPVHLSSCALHYGPAMVPKPCDCGADPGMTPVKYGSEYPKDWKRKEFETLAKPLIKFLNDNFHPHHTAVFTPTSAEILEGQIAFYTEEFLHD